MEFQQEPTNPDNPIVFMDIAIENEIIGRIIIELYADVVPRSAENFRCLCTGERGYSRQRPNVRLHYEATHFTYVHSMFACRGGDVTHSDGHDGESIYGARFAHENYKLLNTAGAVGMVHCNKPNTNNSQFYILSCDSSHLDGSNVVVGYVRRGFGAVQEIEKYRGDWANNKYQPRQKIWVARCGQLPKGEPWRYADDDWTADKLPPFPLDWRAAIQPPAEPMEVADGAATAVAVGSGGAGSIAPEHMRWALETIRDAAKLQLQAQDWLGACRRYKKCERYMLYFSQQLMGDPGRAERLRLGEIVEQTYNNWSLCELRLCHWTEVVRLCKRVLQRRPQLVQAHYRLGKAQLYMQNYDEAIGQLKRADAMAPQTADIVEILEVARRLWREDMEAQKANLRGLFQ